MILGPDSFGVDRNYRLGSGGFADIYMGSLAPALKINFGFNEVSFKIFKGELSATWPLEIGPLITHLDRQGVPGLDQV